MSKQKEHPFSSLDNRGVRPSSERPIGSEKGQRLKKGQPSEVNGYQKELNQKLDTEEQNLLDSFERNEWKEIDNLQDEMNFAKAAAENFFRKDARINIRLAKHDLTKIKQLAAHEGLPYQTLIASLLHKYAKGHLA